jgi:hypothetical protein
MENKGHADGIKKSIEEIIGANTIMRNKRPSEDNIQQDKFEKTILALEAAEIKTTLLHTEFKMDFSDYNEHFYIAIDSLLELWLGKEVCELVFFYLYDRMNPDGTMNGLMDDEDNEIILETPTDLWLLIKKIQSAKKKK